MTSAQPTAFYTGLPRTPLSMKWPGSESAGAPKSTLKRPSRVILWRGPAAICLSPPTSGSRAILRDLRRTAFDLYVSEPVLEESTAGDATFARKRIESLADVPVLALTSGIIGLAEALVAEGPIPRKA